MDLAALEAAEDEALTWRNDLALQLIRGLLVIFLASGAVIWFAMASAEGREQLTALALLAALIVAVPAVTGRPRGQARAWIIIIPALTTALGGYAFVGTLSGPGVCTTVTLLLAGLLLGRRAMVALTLIAAVGAGVIGWAMVTGRIPAPHPRDVSMTSGFTWIRSLSVTFLAISFFCGLMLAVVTRMERSLRLARRETLRREQAERARAEAELMAVESKQLEMVGRLAAGVAHDFNNNLTAIMGSAELLKLELPEGDARELPDGILQASQRLAELTRQLLAYSRKARMLQVPTDLHEIVQEAVSLLRRSTDPNITIVTELNALQSTVAADAALLQSAVLNLLVNARDAMPEGGTLTVGTTSLELTRNPGKDFLPAGTCVVLEIVDTGRGISKAQLSRIFDPFFTTKPVGKGTGLGLAAVAGTVKAHGGSVEVNSDEGAGSVFRVYLPCIDPDGSLKLPAATTVLHGDGELLLVEDDAMVSMTAVATLQSFGYRVTHAADGKAAIEQVAAHPDRFQLVLLDLRMPGLSGRQTFDRLRELEPGLPILLWSGYGAEQDVSSMLRRGAVGFVQKPYRVAELSRIVAEKMRPLKAG